MNGWFARSLLLVLAGLATLTLIGAIAAVPTGLFDDAPPAVEDGAPPETAPIATAGGETVVRTVRVAGAPPAPAPERWMESIAYALIALAGFAAAALIVLLRIAGHLGEIARREEL